MQDIKIYVSIQVNSLTNLNLVKSIFQFDLKSFDNLMLLSFYQSQNR